MLWFFKKIKLYTKLVPRLYMKVFTSKFICNNLYLLFVFIFIIYLQSSTKLFSITGTSHWMTGSSVKSITGVTFVGKCPWLVCLTYFLSFLSVTATLFDVTSCIFKLKNFNCSNFFVPLPCHTAYGNREVMHQPGNNLLGKQHDHTLEYWLILILIFTLFIFTATYDIHPI